MASASSFPTRDAALARAARCRQILQTDAAEVAWNVTLTPARKRFLLLAAELPEALATNKWADITSPNRQRIKAAPRALIEWASQVAAALSGGLEQ